MTGCTAVTPGSFIPVSTTHDGTRVSNPRSTAERRVNFKRLRTLFGFAVVLLQGALGLGELIHKRAQLGVFGVLLCECA